MGPCPLNRGPEQYTAMNDCVCVRLHQAVRQPCAGDLCELLLEALVPRQRCRAPCQTNCLGPKRVPGSFILKNLGRLSLLCPRDLEDAQSVGMASASHSILTCAASCSDSSSCASDFSGHPHEM